MIKRTLPRALTFVVMLGLGVAPALRAQVTPPTTPPPTGRAGPLMFGGAAGVSFPAGDYGESLNTGFTVQGFAYVRTPSLPFDLRADVVYHRFGGEGFDGSSRVFGGAANVLFPLQGERSGIAPYALAGFGIYSVKDETKTREGRETITRSISESRVGLSGGGGFTFALGGYNSFLEARLHAVFTRGRTSTFFPITLGVMF